MRARPEHGEWTPAKILFAPEGNHAQRFTTPTDQGPRRHGRLESAAYTASEAGTLGTDGALRISESSGLIEIDNGLVKARFTRQSVGVRQEFFAKDGQGGWTKLVMAFNPPVPRPQGTAPLYGDTGVAHEYRLLTAEAFKAMTVGKGLEKEVIVSLSGMIGNNQVEQKVSLNAGLDHFHIQVHATLAGALARLEYLLSCFVFGAGSPDFTHVPCLKRAADDVVADRIFNAPAIIIQKGRLLTSLVPDLDSINQNIVYARGARTVDGPRGFRLPEDPAKISMPTIMDLDLRSGMTPDPLFSFGFADYIIEQHMFWRHENRGGSMARELSARDVRYGFDLFLSADAPPQRGYQKISRYIWKRYGSRFLEQPRPQAMPFAEYAKQCYPAAFAYKGDSSRDTKRYSEKLPYDPTDSGPLPTWLEFDFEGRPAGGIRATPTQWYNDIQFTPWWNCVRDAVGMYWWGKQGSPDLVGKARRIVNLALAAPQDQGIFPSIFRYAEKRWYGCYWKFPADFRMDWTFPSDWEPRRIPTNFWNTSSDLYQTAAASKTGVYLLRYRSECEDDARILPYVRRYGDFLVSRLEKNGRLPAFFARDLKPG